MIPPSRPGVRSGNTTAPDRPIRGRNQGLLPYREFTGRQLSHRLCSPYSGTCAG